jgi:Uma2 family endonuclease
MSVATLPAHPATAADLLELIDRLGGIDPARVRLQPLPGTATEADAIRLNEREKGRHWELVDGTLVEKVMSVEESLLAGILLTLLNNFVRPRRLGAVLGADAMQRVAPGLIRLPDVSFISPAKWRAWRRHRPAIGDFGPDLAVEVLSRSNTRAEMARKRREYFAAGTRLVWEVNPRRRTVTVYTAPRTSTRLTEADTLTGGDVLPGFALPLAELFADPLDGAAP